MIDFLRADFTRLHKSFAFYISLFSMLVMAVFFMHMQATGMNYTVPLSRVIFLPMSMFGIAMAAFVSVFIGTDFSDGFIRNKILVTNHRSGLVLSYIIVSCTACVIVYTVVTAFTTGIGLFFFENNISIADFILYFLWGIGICLVTGCLFSVITILCGNKTRAIILCMGLAFIMLFFCMHTNELLVQKEYKNGILNPHYTGGLRRVIYSILHDINPCGQAAQLSSWEILNPFRGILINLLIIIALLILGCTMFCRKDII